LVFSNVFLFSRPWIAALSLLPSFCFCLFAILGFELRAYTLSHSTSAFLCWVFFEIGSREHLVSFLHPFLSLLRSELD
jgi:hypothetical protein